MRKTRLYLIVQAALCALVAALLCAAAIGIFREGTARRAEDPLEPVYTREAVAEKLAPVAPLIVVAIGMTAGGLLLGIQDEDAERPAKGAGPLPGAAGEARRQGRILRIALIVAGIACIAAGIVNGSARDVLYKAANICTECIGLG